MTLSTSKIWKAAVVAAMGLAAGTGTALAQPFMAEGGRTTQPVGHYEFCQQLPAECQRTPGAARPVELTRQLWAQMIEINNAVNAGVVPRTDYEIWGVEERWSYPVNGMGDCEDYALEKRRMLNAIGVPLGNLRITVLRQPNGDGHAVLTVRTSRGDFVLDNLEPRILAWHETEYEFLKWQSKDHAGVWIAIEDDRQMLVGSVRR